MFRSYYATVLSPDSREAFRSSGVGSGVVQLFRAEYDKTGVLQLVPDGEHDLYAEIQSHAASTDMQLILSRYFSGDPSVLSRVQGAYMDITGMPDNIHDALALMDNAKSDFDRLPPAIRDKFGNDVNQFLSLLGTEQWFEAMQIDRAASGGAADEQTPPEAAVNESGGDK